MYAGDLLRNPAVAVGLPVVLGSASGLLTRRSVEKLDIWYDHLKKPKGEPMRAVFPVVWTALYAGMGYASHLLISAYDLSPSASVRQKSSTALSLYVAQLGLNLIWTPLFFGLRKPDWALVDIVGLTGTVYGLTGLAYEINRNAFYLFLPYSLWLTYATYLNAGVWWLNGGEDQYLELRGKKVGDNRPKNL